MRILNVINLLDFVVPLQNKDFVILCLNRIFWLCLIFEFVLRFLWLCVDIFIYIYIRYKLKDSERQSDFYIFHDLLTTSFYVGNLIRPLYILLPLKDLSTPSMNCHLRDEITLLPEC